jgi:hypothetical protein
MVAPTQMNATLPNSSLSITFTRRTCNTRERAEVGNYTSLVQGSNEYFVVLVTSYFRDLASAPKVRWRARAGAPALGQEPKLLPLLHFKDPFQTPLKFKDRPARTGGVQKGLTTSS